MKTVDKICAGGLAVWGGYLGLSIFATPLAVVVGAVLFAGVPWAIQDSYYHHPDDDD